jgi:hypothetical protein
VSKRTAQTFHVENFNLKQREISQVGSQLLKDLDTEVDFNSALESIRENIEI